MEVIALGLHVKVIVGVLDAFGGGLCELLLESLGKQVFVASCLLQQIHKYDQSIIGHEVGQVPIEGLDCHLRVPSQ